MYQIYNCHIFIDYRYQLMRLLNLLVLKKRKRIIPLNMF